jgi:hypothetical protein
MRKGGVGGNYVSHHHLNWFFPHFDTPSACGGELHWRGIQTGYHSSSTLLPYELMCVSEAVLSLKPLHLKRPHLQEAIVPEALLTDEQSLARATIFLV